MPTLQYAINNIAAYFLSKEKRMTPSQKFLDKMGLKDEDILQETNGETKDITGR